MVLKLYNPMNTSSSIHATSQSSLYSPVVARLIDGSRLNELGPGHPNRSVEAELRQLSSASLFGDRKLVEPQMATACLAGLWLCYDFLDESHRLSQDGDDVSFRYWHGIMHRREPDYDNAKYWFRRVGEHPIFDRLFEQSRTLGRTIRRANWSGRCDGCCRQKSGMRWLLLICAKWQPPVGQPSKICVEPSNGASGNCCSTFVIERRSANQ